MQTQKINNNVHQRDAKNIEMPATSKQRDFIQNLQKRGYVDFEVDIINLSKREASSVIDNGLLLAKEAALSDEAHEEVSKETPQNSFPKEEFNKLRFGMCAKLVYSKQDFNLANANGVQDFKSEIQRLYRILSEMERSFAPSSSSSRVEFLHSYMKKHNIRMVA